MSEPRNYKFYKFICLNDDVDSCYIGSTGNFKQRRNCHKQHCHNESCKQYNFKIYQTIRENGGWDNWKMVQIGSRDQITKREAEQIEEQYRKELKADMNERRAFRTEDEYKEYEKEYRENNKEKIAEQNKEYHENNKEKIAEYKHEWGKEYRENNKDKIAEYFKEYRENNRTQINEKQNEKIECECGCKVSRANLLRHKTSMIHQLNLLEIGETSE